jgi:tRNA U54 and U55 pseudouridine synthase Pus10
MKNIRLLLVLFAIFFLNFISTSEAAGKKTKEKEPDPKDCEVCINNLEAIDRLVPANKKSDKLTIEKAITTHCTLSGFGSEWKPNPNLASPKDVKMCYIFEPIKKSVSHPFATGMPKKKVCERLKKDNPDICAIKYRKLLLLFSFFFYYLFLFLSFLFCSNQGREERG